MSAYADTLRGLMKGTHESVLKPSEVDVPVWGKCYVKQLTVAEINAQTADTTSKDDKKAFARAAARVIVEPDGTRVFDPLKDEDISFLAGQPWALLQKVVSASDRFNALTEAAVGEQKNGSARAKSS